MSPCGSSSGARFDRRRAGICVTLAPVKRAALTVLALALCAGASLSAQRVQRRVFITAADGSGTPILDLTAGEFELLENGVSREVLRATRVTGPMRIALVVDSSSSVAPLLNNLRAGLTTFLDELPGEHEITLISTGGQIRIRQPVTTDRKKLKTAVGTFASDGGANSVVETMMEVDQRFLKGAPGQWPVLVLVTTDQGATRSEPNYDRFNRFVSGFVARGGTAHAIVLHDKAGGITTEFVMNVVENTGGYYESMAIANVLPDKMKMVAEHMDANYKAMSNWYEVEFVGDGRAQAPRVQIDTKRSGVSLKISTRRPF
jgi:von Willebrand factor type A domain